MSDDHAKYGKAFLGKLLTVVAIPITIYYCVKQPKEKEKQKDIERFHEEYKDQSPYREFDRFKEQDEEWRKSISTIIPRDSLR